MHSQDYELSREELLSRYSYTATIASSATHRSPFKFLDSYDADDADIFFGRDLEIEELRRHFHSSGHVLIYGESGCGKSSLVQCGLRSRIPDADALFISPRLHTAGLPTLRDQICAEASDQLGYQVEEEADLVTTLHAVRKEASRPLVLFFDQFEELFIFHDADERKRFANELAAIQDGKLNIKVIIGIRQDYLAHLSELEDTVEGLFDNRFWLRRMSPENASAAVVKACRTCDVAIDDQLADSIIHRLNSDSNGVELPYLQVVMDRLYRQELEDSPEHMEITEADVKKLGDIADILATFLLDEVSKLPSPDTGRQLLKAFVSREGTRRNLDRKVIGQEAAGFGEAIPRDELDTHLNQLTRVRILREIADSGSFELRHDSLATTVASWISEVEKELLEVRENLINRFSEYELREHAGSALLDRSFLDYLGVYKQRLNPLLSESLRGFVDKSRKTLKWRKTRKRVLVGGASAMITIGLFWLVSRSNNNDAEYFAKSLRTDPIIRQHLGEIQGFTLNMFAGPASGFDDWDDVVYDIRGTKGSAQITINSELVPRIIRARMKLSSGEEIDL